MNKIVLFPNVTKDETLRVTERICEILRSHGARTFICRHDGTVTEDGREVPFPVDADLMIVVGGDGTFLDAVPFAVRHRLPLLGVNLGRVGYLAEVEPTDLSVLSSLFCGAYTIREQMLLEVEYDRDGETVRAGAKAFNDVILANGDTGGVASYEVSDQNGECMRYRADGVVIATPAGSTAYSLSCGGPIVAHGVDAILLTPVCPHTFFNRSVLFGKDDKIGVRNTGDAPLTVSIDGRFLTTLRARMSCTIKVARESIRLVTFGKNKMFSTLFNKMRLLENI